MKNVRVTRNMRTRAWTSAVSPTRENSFAGWIVSRWTPPDRVRRMSPSKAFRAARHSGTWLGLSNHARHASWHMTLTFGFRTWTSVTQHVDLYRTVPPSISVSHRPGGFVQWMSLLQISPAAWAFSSTSALWNCIRVAHHQSFSFHVHVPPQIASNPSRERRVRGGWATLSRTMLPPTSRHYSVTAWMKINQIWQRSSWQSRSSLRKFRSRMVLHTTATQTMTTHNKFSGPIHALAVYAKQLYFLLKKSNHELLTQSLMVVLPKAKPATEDEKRHPHLILHLRDTMDRARSRPSMQFAQAATPNQPEVLSAIRNMEKVFSKGQRELAPTPHAVPDMQRLTSQIYDQLERQLRIERERRGR